MKEKYISGSLSQAVIVIFVLVALALAGAYLYFNSSERGVIVDVGLPERDVDPGDIFDVDVVVTNNSQSALQNARIALGLPMGVRFLDNADRVNEVREISEKISIGTSIKETYRVVVLPGGENGDYALEARVSYSTDTFSNDFERRKTKEIKIRKDAFSLEFTAPERVTAGKAFPLEVRYGLPDPDGDALSRFLVLEGESVKVADSSTEPVLENRWLLEERDENVITASMVVGAKSADVLPLKARIVVEFSGKDYTIVEKQKDLLLEGASLALSVELEDPKNFAAPGERLAYRVSYKNNTEFELKDAVLRAELVGEMFDYDSIQTSGAFDALSKTVTWSSGRFGELRELAKGEEGSFNVGIKVKPGFPLDSPSDRNFLLKVRGSIESPTVIQGTNADRTSNFANLEVKVSGSISVDARGYFRDADSGILNEGPFPPRAGQATEYTVHWRLANAGTDADQVTVRAHLESGVEFTGEVKGTTNTLPSLDSSEREVVWAVGKMAATEGLLSPGPEAIFQVRLTPGAELVGQFAPLLGISSVSAEDTFTGVDLLGTDGALTTALPDDGTVGPNQGKVIQ